MNEIKKRNNKIKLTLFMILLITSTIAILMINAIAAEIEGNLNSNIEDNVGRVVKTYTASGSQVITREGYESYFNDNGFDALNDNISVYCLSEGGTLHNNGEGAFSKGNLSDDISNYITVSDSGVSLSQNEFSGHQEGNSTSVPGPLKTNFVFNVSDYTLDKFQAYVATFNDGVGGGWHNTGQYAIWGTRNDLYLAAWSARYAEEELENNSDKAEPNVYPIKNGADGCGTVYESGNYKIGPFQMTDYLYVSTPSAKKFSGKDLSKYKEMIAGIVGGYIKLDNGITIDFDDLTLEYIDSGNNTNKYTGDKEVGYFAPDGTQITITEDGATYKDDYVSLYNKNGDTYMTLPGGKTVKLEEKPVSSEKIDYWSTPTDYKYPWPNSKFYIIVPKDKCGDAQILTHIAFKYRKIKSSGSGATAEGKFALTTFTCSETTHCTSETYTCSGCSCPGHNVGTEDEYYCSGCVCNGHSAGTTSPYATCDHGYNDCYAFTLTATSTLNPAQPTFAVQEAQVQVLEEDFEREVNVRLTTDLTINKFIVKVDHVGEDINVYNNLTERDRIHPTIRKEKWKKNNTVKVERGDRITYQIVIINKQDQKVKCKIKDILPAESADQTFSPEIDGKWLTVKGNDTTTITVTLRATALEGIHKNTAKIATNNDGNPDYNRTVYGENNVRNNGPVVNVAEFNGGILEDSDYYEIKEYNVGIEKYIYNVDHVATDTLTKSGLDTSYAESKTRKRTNTMTEAIKKDNPVYVEYGDTVTYKIVVYNTVKKDSDEVFGVARAKEPYWKPDKVYVNLKDTLPKKYKDLKITVDGAPLVTGNSSHVIEEPGEGGSTFTIKDLMVPAGGTRTVTVTLTVEEYTKGTIEENKVIIDGDIKNINRGPDRGVSADDKYCVGKNDASAENKTTSDFYKINNYNVFLDKFIYAYDESMQKQNNANGFTKDGLITNADGTLKVSRMNSSTATRTENDGKFDDKVRLPGDNEKLKEDRPVSVEKTEIITYAIKAVNDSETHENTVTPSGNKPGTQVRTTEITDYMQEGLSLKDVTAVIYDSSNNVVTRFSGDGSVPVSVSSAGQQTKDGNKFNVYKFKIGNETILNPGDYIVYYVKAEIVESNMYLFKLKNEAEITILTNINNTDEKAREVKNTSHDENISDQKKSSDYVRLKDLVIAGKVWVDFNRDGYINESGVTDSDKAYYNLNDEAMKRNVVVKLYKVEGTTPTLVRTTKTDDNGMYTFSRTQDFAYYPTFNWPDDYNASTTYQRVDKASSKDGFGNYTSGSKYLNYYIEFEYDGIIYKSTEFYSGMENLNKDSGSPDYGKYEVNYPIDSNAAEFKDVREEFNKKYEYISYDIAYDTSKNESPNGTLTFDKTDHTSQLVEDPGRVVTARSFIKNTERGELVAQGANPDGWANNNLVNSSIENTNLLWLFKHNEQTNSETPATEYLKYINLGLELRENVDISLTKDVYKVKTTIDGDEMEYTFNRNNGLNGNVPADVCNDPSTFLNNYIITSPYGLDIYESDYKMRIEQYKSEAVRIYKGLQAESELNVEVTYRISILNRKTNDDETLPTADVKDTKLKVKISEILDLYDANFMELQFNNDGTMKTGAIASGDAKAKTNSGNYNTIRVKHKDENGYLVDADIVIGEAWYFRKAGASATGERYRLDENSTYPSTYDNEKGCTTADKPVYVQDPNGDFEKVPLTIRGKSNRDGKGEWSKDKNNDFKADGYNTAYISGMEDVLLAEGEDIDIYVKYVLDKEAIEMENTNEDYEETATTSASTSSETVKASDGTTVTTVENTISTSSSSKVTIARSLKIAERTLNKLNPRGLEGIAQVNAYSVWYEDGKEASLVDMDSNAGNLGNTNGNLVGQLKDVSDNDARSAILEQFRNAKKSAGNDSADNTDYYEDMTYKTGIEITADGTENTKEKVNDYWASRNIIVIKQDDKVIRKLSGMVWDDTRSETEGGDAQQQYAGNGIYDLDDERQENSLMNENVEENYDNDHLRDVLNKDILDEEQDIKVRNTRAELVEVVEIPQPDGSSRYYEEVLSDVTWTQVQHIRTNSNGDYTVSGFIPAKYIVRFTYGDTVDPNTLSNAELDVDVIDHAVIDMQLFNGQDYKSTNYAYAMEDYRATEDSEEALAKVPADATGTIDNYATNSPNTHQNNTDTVLAALERPDLSDARDDEIRRLEVNNYSEVMVNEKAEVLKGLANGSGLTETSLDMNGVNPLAVNYYGRFANDEYSEQKGSKLKELTDNTYMNAETVEFLVRTEKLTYEQANAVENIYHNYVKNGILYDELKTIEYKTTNAREFNIDNIDMGIEYRPETAISLSKEIYAIQLRTSDQKILVDLRFYSDVGPNGTTVHRLDPEKSTGEENVQFVTNEYRINPLLRNVLQVNDEQLQGFVYTAVDQEILQGCNVYIAYKFTTENDSEIDRVSKNIDDIRFYGNDKTQELMNRYGIKIEDMNVNPVDNSFEYTANYVAKSAVQSEVYAVDGNGDEYRNRAKTMVKVDGDLDPKASGMDGYFGNYVGYTYYTGIVNDLDTIGEMRFDKIIDYVDTNIDLVQTRDEDIQQNLQNVGGSLTDAMIKDQVINTVMPEIVNNQYSMNIAEETGKENERYLFSLNSPWSTKNLSSKLYETLLDNDGAQYKSIAMIIQDADREDDPNSRNPLFSKFLLPEVASPEESKGTVYLAVSKTLSSETDTDNMQYENLAEIVQFTILTGRRTNFDTTIGNADIHEVFEQVEHNNYDNYGSIEFVTAALETDTAATETITLTPPTGLMKNRRAIFEVVDTTKNVAQITVIAIAVVVAIFVVVKVTIVKIKKKRYK